MNTLGERIRHRRKQLNLSGEVLAKIVGVGQGTISKLETGETLFPSCEYLFPLADALEVSARWLVTGTEPIGAQDSVQPIQLTEDVKRLFGHLQTLEQSKLDAWFTLLGVRRE